MKKGQIYEGIIERVDFPNKGIVLKKAKKVNFFCCMLVYIGKITHNKYAKYDKEIQGCYKEPPYFLSDRQ